jgi:hypothetical protein
VRKRWRITVSGSTGKDDDILPPLFWFHTNAISNTPSNEVATFVTSRCELNVARVELRSAEPNMNRIEISWTEHEQRRTICHASDVNHWRPTIYVRFTFDPYIQRGNSVWRLIRTGPCSYAKEGSFRRA